MLDQLFTFVHPINDTETTYIQVRMFRNIQIETPAYENRINCYPQVKCE